MHAERDNAVFVTVAAWPDWEARIEVYLKSARKQGVDVHVIEKGEKWRGFYHHKVCRLHEWLKSMRKNQPEVRYVIFTDARDVVFIKSRSEILESLDAFDDEKIYFNADKPRTAWPMRSSWFVDQISDRYGDGGFINSGCYVGRIDRIVETLAKCMALHRRLGSGDVRPDTQEERLCKSLHPAFLRSDQFHYQALQVLGDDALAVDTNRRVFACFDGGFPRLKTAPRPTSNGTMPIGDAGILHSPWMFNRRNDDPEHARRWKAWALREGIIDEVNEVK